MTTLQGIIGTIRGAQIVDPAKVNYGWSDGIQPPYISVLDFNQTPEYVTDGVAVRNSTFNVICMGKSVDEAEAIATQVDDLLQLSTAIMPNSRCLLTSYTVGQLDANLYQFGVI